MNAPSDRYVLFYQPPCGDWYVHSHKIYTSAGDAAAAAKKLLAPGTPISIMKFTVSRLDETKVLVP